MPKSNRTDGISRLTDSEAGYIAGFLDGEGTIMLQIKKRMDDESRIPFHFHPVVSFANNNLECLEWIQLRCGGFGYIFTASQNNPKWAPTFSRLHFSSNAIYWLIPQIEKHLIVKRRQALLILRYSELTQKVKGSRQKTEMFWQNFPEYFDIYSRIKLLNTHIPYRVDNLCELMTKKLGELRESLNSDEHGNPQPSRSNVMDFVERKVQRLMREDTHPIIATRAPNAKAKR